MAPCSALRLEDTHKGYRPLEDQFQVAPAEKLVKTTDPCILNEEEDRGLQTIFYVKLFPRRVLSHVFPP
jgi:hypothetical protein